MVLQHNLPSSGCWNARRHSPQVGKHESLNLRALPPSKLTTGQSAVIAWLAQGSGSWVMATHALQCVDSNIVLSLGTRVSTV